MIPTQVIITFLLTTLLFLWREIIKTCWKEQNKRTIAKSELENIKAMKEEIKPRNKQETRLFTDLKGAFTDKGIKFTLEKAEGTFQEARGIFYKYLPAIIRNLKLYISKLLMMKA